MLSVRNLINTTDLTADDITQILDTARSMEEINHRTIKKVPALRGRTIVNLFLEASTRTRSSFEIAEKRLSADSLNVQGSSSSVSKGECLEDTIKTLNSYGIDMFVCRARNAGTAELITHYTDARVINAGDGKHAHPSQALLDLYTMREHFGKLEGLKVAIVGDLLHSRVVGSLAPALRTMGAKVTLVGPPTFQLPEPEVFGAEETYDFDSVIEDADVVYMLRVQLERMEGATIPSKREYNRLWGLTAERHARMKENALVMHPGPMNRGMEIDSIPADAQNSFVTRQVAAGLYTRMAEMYLLLGGEENAAD
ncbi:MAG: aspartate carbamoyltransferase catalytic subunit [Parolsenella sp.]|uniref:aspartate carbamoyltransferase catalytic subunit n=1 Tax=Coriobacteriales TaxID=84999 RepID=UPI002A75592A|nr:aspartate carbamoyltransferase catalytic subunit [Parolsenella sp.]MCI5950654.1 aspartate carbamoyltransferase catalytic subunit [Coriobacteriaceae bacterium]MDY3292635.1 aspartate carbamoyltransferase catalytic subunit [Parolsenella sp.]